MNPELIDKDNISINTVIADLNLFSLSLDSKDQLRNALKIFEIEKSAPGIIINKANKFYKLLPKYHLYQLMSKPYMLELFIDKPIEYFCNEILDDYCLMLPSYTFIAEAAEKALLRDSKYRNDPIVVRFDDGYYKILDFDQLLLAQTHIHLMTTHSLKEAISFKNEILGIASHDLKNPLHIILSFIQILSDDELDKTEQQLYKGYIKDSANAMLDLINNLLDSASKFSKMQLNISRFDLLVLIESVVNKFYQLAADKKQKIIFECDKGKNYLIDGDRLRLKEVFENLISNAIKYSPLNETIIIKTDSINNKFRFSVKDNGPGMSDEDKQKIFGKFQRLSAKPTGNETSTGLGLYIVKNVVEMHNGSITVESELHKGSTFSITLPNINSLNPLKRNTAKSFQENTEISS